MLVICDERELSNNVYWPISVNEGGTIESRRRTFTGFSKYEAQQHNSIQIRICIAVSHLSLVAYVISHREDPAWMLGLSVWNLWLENWHWDGFPPSTSVFPYQYHSINAPYSNFIHLPPSLYNLNT
jgi:hypothetical protein